MKSIYIYAPWCGPSGDECLYLPSNWFKSPTNPIKSIVCSYSIQAKANIIVKMLYSKMLVLKYLKSVQNTEVPLHISRVGNRGLPLHHDDQGKKCYDLPETIIQCMDTVNSDVCMCCFSHSPQYSRQWHSVCQREHGQWPLATTTRLHTLFIISYFVHFWVFTWRKPSTAHTRHKTLWLAAVWTWECVYTVNNKCTVV